MNSCDILSKQYRRIELVGVGLVWLLGVVFLLVGLLLLVAGLQVRRQAASIRGRAPGTVVGLVPKRLADTVITSDVDIPSLFPVVTWTTPAGVQETFTGRSGSRPPRHHVGQSVMVAYDERGRRPPSLVGDASVLAIILIGVGTVFTVAGAVVLVVAS